MNFYYFAFHSFSFSKSSNYYSIVLFAKGKRAYYPAKMLSSAFFESFNHSAVRGGCFIFSIFLAIIFFPVMTACLAISVAC